jgi:hypothetical protein
VTVGEDEVMEGVEEVRKGLGMSAISLSEEVDGVVVEVHEAKEVKEVKRVPVSVRLMAVKREKEQGMFCFGEEAPGMQEAGDCSGIGTSMRMGMFAEGG